MLENIQDFARHVAAYVTGSDSLSAYLAFSVFTGLGCAFIYTSYVKTRDAYARKKALDEIKHKTKHS